MDMKIGSVITSVLQDASRLLLPHLCMGCGSDALERSSIVCAKCLLKLPSTNHFVQPKNEVYEKFAGRIQIEQAASMYYFTKQSLLQHLMKQLKYHRHAQTGLILGAMLGHQLSNAPQFDDVSVIIPLPLNEQKLHQRGYNQAALIAQGITEVWPKPYNDTALSRSIFTQTQTKKNRISRFENMEDVFVVNDSAALKGQHVLLIDDIVTTGATLEACGLQMLTVSDIKISFATVACTH